MPEKVVPDLEFFKDEIKKESQENLILQYAKTAERLLNFPPEKMPELHLQDWYSVYWNLTNLFQYVQNIQSQTAELLTQIKPLIESEKNPVRRQYLALAFLMLGDFKSFRNLADQNLWSKNLRDDYEAFSKFNKLAKQSTHLPLRSNLRRNEQIKNFLQDKYSDLIQKYSSATLANCPKVSQKDYQIYFCWLQGEENLPPLIQCCYNSLKQNAGRYKIIFIDAKNFSDYVTLPEYILKKFEDGKISPAHFADIIRINLLEKYGGLWLDSTILVTEPLEKYKNFWKLPFYTQKFYKEKSNFCPFADNPSYGRWATFILGAAVLHNPLFAFMKDFYNEYWKEYDEILDYVLMDFVIDSAYENIHIVKQEIDAVLINNEQAWTLLDMLQFPYNQCPYDKILRGNFLNKLNWKKQLDWQMPGTVLLEIKKKYFGE